jgi:leader peptidase (prepilin peptidase)/N-methyltransferase
MTTIGISHRPEIRREFYYAIVGLLGAALAATPFLRNDIAASMVTQIGVVTIVVLCWIDLTTTRVPNAIVAPAVVFVVMGSGVVDWAYGAEAAFGAGVSLTAMFALAVIGRGAMGMGDVKFAALSGSLLGWSLGLASLVLGFAFGAVVTVLVLLLRLKGRKDSVPLTPFLGVGAIATGLMFGFILSI